MQGEMELDGKMENQELISALADGQLQGEALARGVWAATTEEGRRTWHSYCVIGEVLRGGQAPVATPPDVFLARLQARLEQEPQQQAPAAPQPISTRARAANDWKWKLVAGAASVAAIAAVGWNVWGSMGPVPAGQPQLASGTGPAAMVQAASDTRPGTMIRDPRLDQLLQAHRQLGGATALQTSSGFLRNATFEGPAR